MVIEQTQCNATLSQYLYEKCALDVQNTIAQALLISGEFKHEVRQFQKPYDNQQAEQISLMV